MEAEELKQIAVAALEDLKAVDIAVLDVRNMTSITDFMIVASGNSSRHVKSLINNVIEKIKANGIKPLGIEGEKDAQWCLVDVGDIVVHVMLPQVRDFYQLEKFWSVDVASDSGKISPSSVV